MKKCGKIFLIVLLVVLSIAVLAACNPTGQNSSGGNGNTTPPATTETTTYYLSFQGLQDNYVVGEFSLSDVTAFVTERKEANGKITTSTIGDGFAVADSMVSAEDRAKLNSKGRHRITVTYRYNGEEIWGTFEVQLLNPVTTKYTVTLNLNGGTQDGFTTATKLVAAGTYDWLSFCDAINAASIAVPRSEEGRAQTLVAWTYGNGLTFGKEDTLSVTADVTLTAQYDVYDIKVVFDANLPDDPTAVAPQIAEQFIARNGKVLQPHANDFSADTYNFKGWKYDNGTPDDPSDDVVWNFKLAASDQISSSVSEIRLVGVWELKTNTVTFDFSKGYLISDASVYPTDVTGLEKVSATAYYDANGNATSVSVSGIKYGTALNKYYIAVKPTASSINEVNLKLADFTSYVTKGTLYEVGGIFNDKNFSDDSRVDFAAAVYDSATLYVQWQTKDGEAGDEYCEATFNFTLKNDDTYTISLKDSEAGIISVPATYNGKAITEIAAGGFSNCKTATSLNLQKADNLTTIGASAFAGCEALEFVTLPDNNKISYIGEKAFNNTVWLAEQREKAAAADGTVLFGDVLINYVGNTATIDLGEKTFAYVSPYAFENCSALTEITLPATLKRIETNAFANCASLTTVNCAGTEIEYIDYDAFKNTNYISGEVNRVIGNVFYRYLGKNETSFTVPAGITVIAEQAFKLGANLAAIDFEEESNIVSVGENAFAKTSWAINDADGFVIVNGILCNYVGKNTTATVPDEVVKIASGAFSGFYASSVRHIAFRPSSLIAEIEDHAFMGAVNLESISFYQTAAPTIKVGTHLFCNGSNKNINSTFKVYSYGDKGVTWDKYIGKLTAITLNGDHKVAINPAVIEAYYLTDADDKVDFVTEWEATTDGTNYIVTNGLLVTRGDGVTISEDLVCAKAVIEGLDANSGNAGRESYVISDKFTYDVYGTPVTVDDYEYTVIAAINESTFRITGYGAGDGTTEAGALQMYTSQREMNLAVGTLTFEHTNGVVVEVPLTDSAITVTGYNNTVGTREITLSYNLYGRALYTRNFYYTVSTPLPVALEQVANIVMPIGATASNYYNQIQFYVVRNDGNREIVNMSTSGISIEAVDGNASYRTLDTTTSGLHVATISYKSADTSANVIAGTLLYSVELTAVPEYFTYSGGTVTGVTAGNTNREMYVIPANYNDTSITEIGAGVFKGMTNLRTVYIPHTVTNISASAFEGCTKLQNVYYFSPQATPADSIAVTDIKIVEEYREATADVSITGIKDYALTLNEIVIPDTLSYESAVSYADDISTEEKAKYYEDANLYGKFTLNFNLGTGEAATTSIVNIANKLAGYKGTVYIPDSAIFNDLADTLFKADIKISKYATGQKTVNMNELTFIYDLGTYGALKVTKKEGKAYVKANAAINVQSGVVYIPEALSGVNETSGYTYSYGITGLESGVFDRADIEYIYIPSSIVYIGESGIDGLFGTSGNKDASIAVYSDASVQLVRPEEHFPTSVATIGAAAFKGCSSLVVDFTAATKLTTIGKEAFSGCTSLKTVEFAAGSVLTEIGESAFAGCSAVQTVDLGNTVIKEIGANAFAYCSALTKLVLPETVAIINSLAFYDCQALAYVTVAAPTNITAIGSYAFANCAFNPSVFDGAKGKATDAFQNCAAKA